MSNSDNIRWLQRLEHFETAVAKLTDACKRDSYSELEMAGVIQFFVFSQELAWNTLKDLLYVEGIEARTPRAVWREAHTAGFVDDIDTALSTIAFRNELSHRYSWNVGSVYSLFATRQGSSVVVLHGCVHQHAAYQRRLRRER